MHNLSLVEAWKKATAANPTGTTERDQLLAEKDAVEVAAAERFKAIVSVEIPEAIEYAIKNDHAYFGIEFNTQHIGTKAYNDFISWIDDQNLFYLINESTTAADDKVILRLSFL